MTPDGYLEWYWIVAIVFGGVYAIGIVILGISYWINEDTYDEPMVPGWAILPWPLYAIVQIYRGFRAELHSECMMSRRSRFCAKCGRKK